MEGLHKWEWMSWSGLVYIVSEVGKGILWILPRQYAKQTLEVVFIDVVQITRG